MNAHPEMGGGHRETSAGGLLKTLLALLFLAGLSLVMRFVHLGSLSFPVALGIACIKALLIAVFFMEILTEKVTSRFAIAAGLVLFAIFLALVLADVLTRSIPPLQSPPGTEPRYRG
jgi:cytochrome c oxidase subunit 4